MNDELSRLVDGLPGLIWTARHDANVDFVNQRWSEFTGVSASEAMGHGWRAAIHADDLPMMDERWRSMVDTGAPNELELRLRRFDGVYRWFLVRIKPICDASGNVVKWCGIDIDIDDRKRLEQDLNEPGLAQICESIPGLVCTMNANGEVLGLNSQLLEYFGRSSEQMRNWAASDAVHPQDLPRITKAFAQAVTTGSPYDVEHRCRRADGVYRWFQVRALPMRGDDGAISGWLVVLTDIEDRKQAEQATRASERNIDDRKRAAEELRRSEAFLAEGQRLSLTGSFSWVLDSDEWTLSEQARRIFGLRRDEYVTLEQIESRIHPEDLPLLSAKVKAAQRGVTDYDHEFRLRMPDGAVKYLRTNVYLSNLRVGRSELIGAVQDVTQWRLSEEALGKVRSELAHVTRVASLGALTASIAHEVNQPLSGIVTNANTCLRMLATETPNLDGARETARRTIRDANRAAEVITRLRAMFAKKGVVTEPVDLNEATQEVLALSASELQRAGVVLRVDLSEDLPLVIGDRVQLQQVVLNLLLNAAAAMSSVDDRPRKLSIRTETEGGQNVRLAVRDVGVGLDPQTVEQLFEPFYTTKSGGMGVGLSVSRSIVEGHGGRLWAEPNDGPGSTFSCSIPRAVERRANARAPTANPALQVNESAHVVRNS